MSRFAPLGILVVLAGCVSAPIKELSHEQMSELLAEKRGAESVCVSKTPDCLKWTLLAYQCEKSFEAEEDIPFSGGVGNPCSKMEEFREKVTGIELSSARGAYAF